MYLTDPIADMLTRIRNANAVMHEKVDIPFSKMKERIAEILKEQGYISNYKIVTDGTKQNIRVYLKYDGKERVIKGIKRISKPGRRVYSSVEDMPRVLSGLGIAIVSTSKGIVTDKVARMENVGGEVLAFVW
ncbi:30S ribosomal protein S8 [Fusobacterium necrophorum subsp. funduliforme]|uniref:Small ribosomal subunit protein uS8 n=4 Tax=Fusobacterium necrophorum TaxID=859 RepID=A0AAN3VW81_9FUSO|nr:30S ribosomal protein S8 [Fusobacterium necrophorum]EHO16372.1 30S ribosomal protein S8 [Fusobacterium necrophorum subsp. funduliforme 1_1_36S]AVQ20353.1 30S ribosomal protein S8 [Fusobacterium necrophorum subsp. funduliforme]AYV93951.1 30S ribosomal protein S8 [Fusobacterium necrophorum subsp. funduliforme]AYV96117.1 30S ribosomal protein S8 [Fusobacterium necrophorum subsp. funduliforme]EFS24009.1 ribosomal protein S8 [Fusobacterium necrophorum D12]